jgi:hypothetical protein
MHANIFTELIHRFAAVSPCSWFTNENMQCKTVRYNSLRLYLILLLRLLGRRVAGLCGDVPSELGKKAYVNEIM